MLIEQTFARGQRGDEVTTAIGQTATDRRGMEPLKVTLKRVKETKNTIRYEELEGGEPPIVGTLYLQKWATHRLEDPETITATIEAAQNAPSA